MDSPDLPRTVDEAGEPQTGPERGQLIGRFLILGTLGMGGMGLVLSAYDPQLDRKVALKLLRGDVWRGELAGAGREALMREAQAMAKLSHANVVHVYEVGIIEDGAYVVMELVEGRTLRAWLREKERGWAEILDLLARVGQGLAAVHRAGLTHLDVKPDNVLIGGDGQPRLSDFGLAGLAAAVGTPAYMPPEQPAGEATPATDQYAFCVTLWEALQGERPPPGAAIPARGKAPARVFRALARGLAARPEARWPSMDDLLGALRPRAPVALRVLGAAAVLLVVGGAAFVLGRGRAGPTCEAGGALVASVWDPRARDSVASAFGRTGRPYAADTFARVDASLRATLASWSAAHRDACEATYLRHEQSETMLDLRMACLGRARAEIASLVSVLEAADGDVVDRAVPAMAGAGDVAACSDLARLGAPVPPPADPATAATVEALRGELAHLEALRRLGKWKEGLQRGRELLPRARATGYAPILASALVPVARFELDVGALEAAVEMLYEAVRVAAPAHDDDAAAHATSLLVLALGARQLRFDAAEVAYRLALAATVRAGLRPVRLGRLFSFGGRLAIARGQADRALFGYQLALALELTRPVPDPSELAGALEKVGQALDAAGRPAQARPFYERAVATMERAVGPEHPSLARVLLAYGFALANHGLDCEAAEPVLERSLGILERAFGPDHRRVGEAIYPLAIVYESLGRLAEARASIERAIRLVEAEPRPDPTSLVSRRDVLAVVTRKEGHAEAAHLIAQETLAIKRRIFGREHAATAVTLQLDADNLLALGRAAEALAEVREAVAIFEKVPGGENADLGDALAVMGDALAAAGQEAEAIPVYERSLAVQGRVLGGEGPWMHRPLLGLADVLLERGDAAAALRLAERALRAAPGGQSGGADAAQLRIARARWVLGQDRAAALAEARAARRRLAALSTVRLDLARTDRWLAGAAAR